MTIDKVYIAHVCRSGETDVMETYDTKQGALQAKEDIEDQHLKDGQQVDIKERQLHRD